MEEGPVCVSSAVVSQFIECLGEARTPTDPAALDKKTGFKSHLVKSLSICGVGATRQRAFRRIHSAAREVAENDSAEEPEKQTLCDGYTLQSGCNTPTGQSETPTAPDCRQAGRAAGIRWPGRCQVQSGTGIFRRSAEPDCYSTRFSGGSSIPHDTDHDRGLFI